MKKIGRILSLLGACILGTAVMVALAIAIMGSGALSIIEPTVKFWNESPSTLSNVAINQHTVMYDKNGNQFAEVWSEDRKDVSSLDDISPFLRDGAVSAEDKNFYKHGAIDLVATVRSFLTGSGGGSGITQQLMKNLVYYNSLASKDEKSAATKVTISRKVKELKLATNYEKTHSKNDILLKYLNTVAVGSPNTYGVEAASETIFNKKAKDLTLGEAAAFAGSINNPSLYNLMNMNDKSTYDRIKARQKYVLGRMLEDKKITKQQYNDALKENLTVNIQQRAGNCGTSKYPFYCQYVLSYLYNDKAIGSTPQDRAAVVGAGGLSIKTNLDPGMLEKLEYQLKKDYGVENRAIQATAVVQPGTGAILAIGANRDWGADASKGQTQIVLPNSPTQVGSTYKMITLAAALNNGWTESELTNDVTAACPWSKPGFDTPAGGIQVSTSCSFQGGHLTYQQATAYSSNVWFAELESRIGVLEVKKMSAELGLNTPPEITARSASFTLGVVDNTPIQMAAAYATFANKGVYCPATPVQSVKMMDGSAIRPPDDWDPSSQSCHAVMSPRSASIVLKAENANVNGNISGRFGADAAIQGRTTVGKSGTGDNYANISWTQTTAQFTVFSDAYDPRGNFQYPLYSLYWRGVGLYGDRVDTAPLSTTRDFIINALDGVPNVGLDFNNQQTSFIKTSNKSYDMITVPNLVGMDPESALTVLKDAGFHGAVLKQGVKMPAEEKNAYYAGKVVVSQSVKPGTSILAGSNKVIELKLGKD